LTLGNNAAGERDNAARAAEKFRQQHSLTWADLLAMPPVPPEPIVIPETAPPPPPEPRASQQFVAPSYWIDWPGIRTVLLVAAGLFAFFWFFHA
jgi:hypothetical protein